MRSRLLHCQFDFSHGPLSLLKSTIFSLQRTNAQKTIQLLSSYPVLSMSMPIHLLGWNKAICPWQYPLKQKSYVLRSRRNSTPKQYRLHITRPQHDKPPSCIQPAKYIHPSFDDNQLCWEFVLIVGQEIFGRELAPPPASLHGLPVLCCCCFFGQSVGCHWYVTSANKQPITAIPVNPRLER